MTARTFEGGCACGFIRYRAVGEPTNETYCHCSICRRASGAPVVAWFSLPSNRFRFTQGQPARFDSSDAAYREFCPKCGTQLTFREHAQPQEVDITIASMDDPNVVTPKDHIWTESRIGWFELADALPRYAQRRESGSGTTAPG